MGRVRVKSRLDPIIFKRAHQRNALSSLNMSYRYFKQMAEETDTKLRSLDPDQYMEGEDDWKMSKRVEE